MDDTTERKAKVPRPAQTYRAFRRNMRFRSGLM